MERTTLQVPFLPRQVDTGPYFGAFLFLYGNAAAVIGLMMQMIGAGTFWGVNSEVVMEHLPWMNFPLFLGFLFLIQLISMLFVYIFVTPSVIRFNWWQAYRHHNPVRDDFRVVLEKLEEMQKKLEELSNKAACEGGG